MKDKINFKIFKPFGSSIARAELPLELLKDFKEDLKNIRADKKKQKDHDWGERLVGHLAEEYLITPEIMLKWKQKFFDPIINSYIKRERDWKKDKVLHRKEVSRLEKDLNKAKNE